jgi:trk system potassium uptake protein TrkH
MKVRVFLSAFGSFLKLLSLLMLIPGLIGALYRETDVVISFALSAMLCLLSGILMTRLGADGEAGIKEGLAVVAIGWLGAAFFGALPYNFLGIRLVDALFESMSAFTTTGATTFIESNPQGYWIINATLADQSLVSAIVRSFPVFHPVPEPHYFGLLFWRSFAQWLGGMGIILLFIAILPQIGVAGRQLYRAEVPGPTKDVLTPRVRDTAKILWTVYLLITVVEIILLVAFGVPLYDAVCNTFSTLATGGFSPHTNSIAAYGSPIIEWIVLLFMFLSGANFALHHRVLYGDRMALFRDPEFQFYSFIVVLSTGILLAFGGLGGSIADQIRLASFQVVSIMTTTGFVTANFDQWSPAAKFTMMVLMFMGACAGSTGGAIKVSRIQIMLKDGNRELIKAMHPRAVMDVKLAGGPVREDIVHSIQSFINQYVLIFSIAVVLIASNCYITGVDMGLIDLMAGVATTLGNVGPGLGRLFLDFHALPDFSKMVCFFCMWIGRLEIIPALVLLVPDFWKG